MLMGNSQCVVTWLGCIRSEDALQQRNVGQLVLPYLVKATANVGTEASILESCIVEEGKTFAVKCSLEEFQVQSELQYRLV